MTGGQERSDSGEMTGGQERSDSGDVTGGPPEDDHATPVIDESTDVNDESADVTETAEFESAGSATAAPENAKKSFLPRRGGPLAVVVVVVALVASAGLAAWLYFFQYRTDQQTDDAASKIALDAASTGTVALLSYSPDSLDKDFTTAKSHLTGDFLSYYTQFTQEVVTPAAKQKQVMTKATVVQAALAEMKPDSATALVFVNQATTSAQNPDGAFAASSVKVGLTKIDGTWLISSFDPV